MATVEPVTLRPVPRAPPGPEPVPEPPTEEEIGRERVLQRQEFLARWGRPPLPASPVQPSPEELEVFVEDVLGLELAGVDCFTYPCVATAYEVGLGLELGGREPEGLRETFPHALAWASNSGLQDELRWQAYTIAFLDAPLASDAERYFTARLVETLDRAHFDEILAAKDVARSRLEAQP